MNEQELTTLLERAAARTPIKAVPWDEITSEGQTPPTHRRPLLLLSVVTLTALAVLGVVFTQQMWGGAPPAEAPLASPTSSPSDLPVAPPGMRLVGRGSIVVAVPEGWATEIGGCYDLPFQNRVFFPSDADLVHFSCAGLRPPNTSSVQFYDSRSRSVTGLVNDAVLPDEVNGVSVLRTPLEPGGAADVIEGVIVVPSEHLLIWVDSPDVEVVKDILNSVASLPEGYVAIPSAQGTWKMTRDEMVQAGLEVSVIGTDEWLNGARRGDITQTDPSLGSVVRKGSSVEMMVLGFANGGWTG